MRFHIFLLSSLFIPPTTSWSLQSGSGLKNNFCSAESKLDPSSFLYQDNRNEALGDKTVFSTFLPSLILATSCLLFTSSTITNALPLFETQQSNALISQQQQHLQHQQTIQSSPLLLATYSSEGSGGLPFLSPFQTPGTIPLPIDPKFDNAEARNRAFDDAFDQDKRDRDAYYAQMALQAREKKMQQLKEQRQALGLDYDDSGPRFGDQEVASMASLKKQLSQKDPATMTPAEFKEFNALIQSNP